MTVSELMILLDGMIESGEVSPKAQVWMEVNFEPRKTWYGSVKGLRATKDKSKLLLKEAVAKNE